jgi:hypothetical protein
MLKLVDNDTDVILIIEIILLENMKNWYDIALNAEGMRESPLFELTETVTLQGRREQIFYDGSKIGRSLQRSQSPISSKLNESYYFY